MVGFAWPQKSDLVLFGGGRLGLHLFCHGREFCGLVVGTRVVRHWRQRLLNGPPDRLQALDGPRFATSRQFLDADDRLTGHALLHLACPVVNALHRLARYFCGLGSVGGGGHVDDSLDRSGLGKAARNFGQAH